MSNRAFEIEQELRKLTEELRELHWSRSCERIIAIARHHAREGKSEAAIEVEVMRDLAQMARSARSHWSGGHSERNLCEQIERTVALDLADRRMTLSKLIDQGIKLSKKVEGSDGNG